jgi:cell division control protein 6
MSLYGGVFKDETKLDINYLPYSLPHRGTELRLLKEFFGFALKSPETMTQRVVITGEVGTGKTVLSQRFGADILRESQKVGINLRYVHVNCREYRGSLFLTLQHVVSMFHPNFPKRGYSPEELLQSLLQVLDEEKTHVILTLDEFESLVGNEGSEAVYKLTRLQETRQGKPQRLSLICVLRNLRTIEQLDESTRSTLQSNIISLSRYSKPQLAEILVDRVSLAFRPSTVPEDTVNLISELACSEGGNARFGIELLWRAGKYADAQDSAVVTPEHVRKAVSSIIPSVRKDELYSLNLHEKLLLLGISRLFKENQDASISLSQAEQAYAIACEEFGAKQHSHTQLWKYLQRFSGIGLVKTAVSSAGGSKGRSTLIYLPEISASDLERKLDSLLEEGKG